MSLFGINFGKPISPVKSALQELWPMTLLSHRFIDVHMSTIFDRILSEVFARSVVIPDEFRPLLRGSMEESRKKGLIDHISSAMSQQKSLVLVYEAGILIEPDYGDRTKILADIKAGKNPPRTIALSFQEYHKSSLLRQYLFHKYLLLCTQNKALNLSTAVQIKINDLRASVGMSDFDSEGGVKAQAKQIVEALLDGIPAAMDAKDFIELTNPDTSALKEVALDLHAEMSFILGLPPSWFGVDKSKGLGDSGDAESRAIERGLEPYFWECAYPSFLKLFDHKLTFKTEDFRNITPALESMRTFQLDDGELLPKEIQQRIIYQLLDIQEEPPGVQEVEKEEPRFDEKDVPDEDDEDDKEGEDS